jgi:thioredoxin reductase
VNGPFADQLGCEKTETGLLKVTGFFNETSVRGVFAADDCGTPATAVVMAMATGSAASAGAGAQVQVEK